LVAHDSDEHAKLGIERGDTGEVRLGQLDGRRLARAQRVARLQQSQLSDLHLSY
jgi:hypothetical protein